MKRRLEDIYEAVGPDQFTALLGEELHRRLQRTYAELPGVYSQYCSLVEVPDFRNQNIISISSTEDLEKLLPGEEYKELTFTEAAETYRVYRYGKALSIPWEFVVNDDLRGINRMVDEIGRSARRAVAKFAASLLASVTEDSTITGDLNYENLADAITAFNTQLNDADGPLGLKAELLIVPPKWEITAKNLLASAALVISGDTDSMIGASNPLQNALQLVVDPFLEDDDWYVAASPRQADGIELAFLQGYKDQPKVLKMRGTEEAEDLDFWTDVLAYKVRHVFGGAVVDEHAILHIGSGA